MFSARTVARAAFCVAPCLIVILSLYFLPVIGVLGLTLGAVLCVQMDCDPQTPAWRACYAVQPMSAGVAGCAIGDELSRCLLRTQAHIEQHRRAMSRPGRSGYPRFSVIFPSLPSHMPGLTPQIRRRPFPSRSFPIHYLLIQPFRFTISELSVAVSSTE
jgi:hypothetical protein